MNIKSNLVWYVTYGSNLYEDRFLVYIKGGKKYNDKKIDPCDDITPPRKSIRYDLPYNMFYAHHSPSWKEHPVSFLDISEPGFAYGRAYLITKEQFKHVRKWEGKGTDWYCDKIYLGEIESYSAFTLTCSQANPIFQLENRQHFEDTDPRYQEVLIKGMQETTPELTLEEILEYLKK